MNPLYKLFSLVGVCALLTISGLQFSVNSCRAANSKPLPRRIVSLTPGITEILYRLGLGDKIVGDTTFCDYPPDAKSKPHVGDSVINYEELVALKPDLIIGDSLANQAGIGKIESMGLPLDCFQFDSLEDIQLSIRAIGIATGTSSQAHTLINSMESKESESKRIVFNSQHPAIRYAFVIGAKPLWVAGKRAFVSSALDMISAVNIAPSTNYQAWSLESLIASKPNVVFCAAGDKSIIMSDPAWMAVPAVQHGNVFIIDPNTAERPGPRLADALFAMSKQLAGAKL
jgi:iron complex transport system substrate-binding protein